MIFVVLLNAINLSLVSKKKKKEGEMLFVVRDGSLEWGSRIRAFGDTVSCGKCIFDRTVNVNRRKEIHNNIIIFM